MCTVVLSSFVCLFLSFITNILVYSFPENSLNVGVRFNEQISPVPWHFVKSRFHCIAFKRRMMRKVRSGALYPGGTYNRMYVLIITSGAYT